MANTQTPRAFVEYKTKPFDVRQGKDSTETRKAINFKKTLGRTDCNLRPVDHRYYNSDLFPGMLNRAARQVIGEYREWAYLDELPAGVTVDTSKFLAVVRIELPESFR